MQIEIVARHSACVAALYRWLGFHLERPVPVVPNRPAKAESGAVVLAAHYNGLMDGFVYMALSHQMLATPSAQWHRTWLGRLLIPGVTITRAKDRERDKDKSEAGSGASNTAAFKTMQSVVRAGHPLLFFPEGTSRLGRERLPVQGGTALLLSRVRRELPDTPVFFTAAHYEQPTLWRSRVAVALDGPHHIPEDRDSLVAWVEAGLLRAQEKAYALPFAARSATLLRLRQLLGTCLLLPVFPVWPATRWAIHRFADDSNVISLWRLLAGAPVVVVCWLAWVLVALLTAQWWLIPAVILSTLLGILLWQS